MPLLPMMAQHQKENMRAHLTAVREMVAALATDDFAKIATAASSIGYSEQMAMMCSRMGAATAGFADVAIRFHQTADTIADAARHEDRKGVLAALDATLQQCVGCRRVPPASGQRGGMATAHRPAAADGRHGAAQRRMTGDCWLMQRLGCVPVIPPGRDQARSRKHEIPELETVGRMEASRQQRVRTRVLQEYSNSACPAYSG
ncbi:MAG: hypothetical protein U1E76_03270 [Planctomycetota bacterium]